MDYPPNTGNRPYHQSRPMGRPPNHPSSGNAAYNNIYQHSPTYDLSSQNSNEHQLHHSNYPPQRQHFDGSSYGGGAGAEYQNGQHHHQTTQHAYSQAAHHPSTISRTNSNSIFNDQQYQGTASHTAVRSRGTPPDASFTKNYHSNSMIYGGNPLDSSDFESSSSQ